MQHVIFVPGILGSRLTLFDEAGRAVEEVWPPTVAEAAFGYHRTDQLVSPLVRSTDVIERQCIPFYGPLLDALREAGVEENSATSPLLCWHYDWRMELGALANALAATLAGICQNDATATIALLCHSMGGLVARGCLENPAHAAEPWRAHVRLALFMATPHDGAALALGRIVGIGGSSAGLGPAQLRQLAAAAGYPSGYQLLPTEAEEVIWRLDNIAPVAPQTMGDYGADPANGLSAPHLRAARDFRALLDPARKPPGCRYFSVVSASHATATRFDGEAAKLTMVVPKSSGDGTVPIRSAAALKVQTGFVVADHVGVTQVEETHALILMLLGKIPVGPMLLDAAVARPRLSVSPMVAAADEPWEAVVAFPPGTTKFDGTIRIVSESQPGASPAASFAVAAASDGLTALDFDGPRLEPGSYRVILEENGAVLDERPLAVSMALGTGGRGIVR